MATPASVRPRDIWLVAGVIGLSAAGDFIALIALGLRANDMHADGIGVAAIFIALWAPIAVLSGYVGLIVDRFETTRLLAVVSAGQAVVAVALAFTTPFALLLLLTAALGAGVAVSQSAEFALVPVVAGGRSTQSANGIVETARYIGFAVGPLAGGALTALGGVRLAMLVDAGSFVAVGLVAVTLRVRRRPQPTHGERRRARDGVSFLIGDRLLALLMAVATTSLLFMSASIPADLVYVQDVLGIRDYGIGIVLTGWTVGMLLAANFLSPRIPVASLAVAAFAAVAVQGLGKALAPLWLVFWFMVVCYFVGGAGHGVKNVAFRSLIHERVPPDRHGRAFAAYNGLRNSAELVALAAGGLLVATLGARGTLFIAGGASAVAGLAGLAVLRHRAFGSIIDAAPVESPAP
jgi:MFS family permease